MDDQLDDRADGNIYVEFGIDDVYTTNCTSYCKRAKIRQLLVKIQSQEVFYTDITEIELQYYIDYMFDFEDKMIDDIFTLMPDVDKSIQKMKKSRRVPIWATKPL